MIKFLIASIPFVILWFWLLIGCQGCVSTSERYCNRYDIVATLYVIDDLTFDEMHGGGKERDGVCWTNSSTIYVRGGNFRRPSDWILGHEIKHLSGLWSNFHDNNTGQEEKQ
jgi:hypothetical protein